MVKVFRKISVTFPTPTPLTHPLQLGPESTLNAKINEVKGEITSIINLATTAALNGKMNEVKDKIANITNVATTTTLLLLKIKYLMLVI